MNAIVAPDPPRLRTLLPADLDCLAAIEARAYTHGWTRGVFADCLRGGYRCRGLAYGDTLLGYGIISVAAEESHLLNLAVDPDYQRQGFGTLLLAHVTKLAQRAGARCMFLEVRPTNAAARALYGREGFSEFGRRRGYYPASGCDPSEDALVLCRRL